MNEYVYDIECSPNTFEIGFCPIKLDRDLYDQYIEADINKDMATKLKLIPQLGIKIFIIYDNINDASIIARFIENCELLVGFNNHRYDDPMVDYLILNKNVKTSILIQKLYNFSQMLVEYRGYNVRKDFDNYIDKYSHIRKSVDLMTLHRFDKLMVSLKKVQVAMKWHRVEDLPLPYDTHFTRPQLGMTIDYNINDLLSTRELLILSKDELGIREYTGRKYKLSPKESIAVLSYGRSKLSNFLLAKFYADATGLEYRDFGFDRTDRHTIKLSEIIDDRVSFKTPYMIKQLEDLKKSKVYVYDEKWGVTIKMNNTVYNVRKGGLHSEDRPGIFIAKPGFIYRDADGTSYYPNWIINREITPEHLNKKAYIAVIRMLTKNRTIAKQNYKKFKKINFKLAFDNLQESDVYKIVINAIFGKTGDKFSFLNDHKAMYETTINGQLGLLELAEDFELHNFPVISANTDGLVCKVDLSREDEYNEICKRWQEKYNINLEYTNYVKYVRLSVNSYLAVKEEFLTSNDPDDIKLKDDFIYTIQLEKGYNKPIVAWAMYQYYVHNILPEETINKHTDIYDFCMSSKVNNDFNTMYTIVKDRQVITKVLSKTTRYFVSKSGGALYKKYKSKKKQISMCKHRYVTIFNDYYRKDTIADYGVDFNYYIGETYKIIYKIAGQTNNKHRPTSTKKRISGPMFDELNELETLNNNGMAKSKQCCENCIFGIKLLEVEHRECTNEDSESFNDYVEEFDVCDEYTEHLPSTESPSTNK